MKIHSNFFKNLPYLNVQDFKVSHSIHLCTLHALHQKIYGDLSASFQYQIYLPSETIIFPSHLDLTQTLSPKLFLVDHGYIRLIKHIPKYVLDKKKSKKEDIFNDQSDKNANAEKYKDSYLLYQ